MTMDTRPPGKSASVATITGRILMATAALALGISLWTQAATWWHMRSYVPVAAELVDATLAKSKSGRGHWPYFLTVLYRYRVNGVAYTSDELGPALSHFLSMSDQAAYRRLKGPAGAFQVWVDPRHPHVSVLEREFGWFRAFVSFGTAMLLMIPVYNAIGAPRPLEADRRVHAERGNCLVLCAVALQWNLMVLPVLSVALLVSAHFFAYVLIAFLLAVLGAGIALQAREAWRKQRALGALTVEIVDDERSPSTLRVRFAKPFGSGCAPARFSPHVWCRLRQVEFYRVTQQRSWKIVWHSPPSAREIERGVTVVDFTFSPPPWDPTESWERGYWDVEVNALDVVVGFKLPVLT
ncbi:MAG TPA: DUF3592 domain-containing protein [Telluria sp.]|jgi:hypothetical protein